MFMILRIYSMYGLYTMIFFYIMFIQNVHIQ